METRRGFLKSALMLSTRGSKRSSKVVARLVRSKGVIAPVLVRMVMTMESAHEFVISINAKLAHVCMTQYSFLIMFKLISDLIPFFFF